MTLLRSILATSCCTTARAGLPGLVFALLVFCGMPAQAAPIYWNLFNIEGESSQKSIYVTYNTLPDMLTDINRAGLFTPDTIGGSAQNVVGSGSDGMTYWNLFNIEGESSQKSIYVTYNTLTDMLTDINRAGLFTPDTIGGSAQNVVGSGSTLLVMPSTVPGPSSLALMLAGLGALSQATRRHRRSLR